MIVQPLHFPDPRLKEKAQTVTQITSDIKNLAQDMLDTMYHYRGIGLAATQIGAPHRVVVMDLEMGEDCKPVSPKVYINPEILSSSQETSVMDEGCLSVVASEGDDKYIRGPVTRPSQIRMRYQDLQSQSHEEDAHDLLARCMQHEIDHLDGILFIDRLESKERERVIGELHLHADACLV